MDCFGVQTSLARQNTSRLQHNEHSILPHYSSRRCWIPKIRDAGFLKNKIKKLSGQEKLAADVAVLEWIVDTARPLTVSQHSKFRKMMQASSGVRYAIMDPV